MVIEANSDNSHFHEIKLSSETFSDFRGWVINPFRAAQICGFEPSNFHVASMKPGAVRGNHFHPETTEWLFIFNGKVKLTWSTLKHSELPSTHISLIVDEPRLFVISPNTYHAIENISDEIVFLIAFNNAEEFHTETISFKKDNE